MNDFELVEKMTYRFNTPIGNEVVDISFTFIPEYKKESNIDVELSIRIATIQFGEVLFQESDLVEVFSDTLLDRIEKECLLELKKNWEMQL